MTQKTRNRLFAIFILAFPVLVLLWFVVSDSGAPLPPLAPLPNPNGYEDLVKAGKMVSTNSWNYESASQEQLRETTAANAEALALARAGFSNECRVPLQTSPAYLQNHISDEIAVRRLVQAFVTEGKLAEKENRPDDAARSYLDAIRLGNESARGGVLVDQMIGTACESLGAGQLENIAGQLDANSCRKTAIELEALDAQRQTWDEVMQQENDWSRRTFTGLRYDIMRLMSHKSMSKNFKAAEQNFHEQELKTRQLMLDLAARAYALDKGHPPASAADLMPDYLKAVPKDPFTGTNLVYSPR